MTKLHIIHGPEKGRAFDLVSDIIHVGRSSENDIQIKDNSVSRKHLKILRKDDKYFIEDLKSTNNTFVDGDFLIPGKEVEVKEGLPIAIGKVLVSIGESMPEDTIALKDFEALSGEFSKTGMYTAYKDRPMTTAKNLELIYKVANALVQSLDLTELFEKLMGYLFDFLKRIDRGAILLIDDKTGKLEQIIARSKYDTGATSLNYSRTIVNKVISEGNPITMPEMKPEEMENFSDSMGVIRSVMCVPLISKSQVRGVIYVDSVDMPHGFRKGDVSLLTALSSPAAVAIENALLYSNLEKLVEERTATLKETEKKLRESEGRFKAIFDNMSSGVIVYEVVNNGGDFIILDLNQADQNIEKIDKKEVLGKSVLEIFPQVKVVGLFEVFKRVWKTGKPENRSVTLYEDQKITGWREYYVYRLPSGEIVSIFDDVTGRKTAEEEQLALQKQLYVSQKMESIGEFAGGTAHNFRNILQAISGNTEYLEMIYGEKPEVRGLTNSIYDSVEKGVDLINSLLQFSKRGGEVQLVDVDLTDVIMKTYEIIEKVFNRNIEITLNLEKGLFVKGNHSLLSQVFMNLFTNARDAMANGGTLLIEAKKKKDKVIAVVSDTGHGMAKETVAKIFDPFFTLKEVGEGTGLGLSTSHGIIQQHKGTVSVKSEPGKGATFEISLPFEKTEMTQEPRPDREVIIGKGQKVLIVDDELPTLDALTNLTNHLGYKAIPVDRAVDALNNYNKWKPDIVLMDRGMPEMDGITCIKKIMEMDPKARIVIISGYEETGANGIDDNVRSLIKGYLTKPCGAEDLSRMLLRVLEE
ncbi:MAG: FHA domain-containing protein [Deltaproteobacteria bacterium]|nr:FHA domain-containing protein [Deltaproteobacteria bacterium]MBW2117554.1 FHA domain-containing protein [Deltaproteobacteria bacterium]MBW2345163.1 FHA domain-containing protein [Deltaproteobacteria bacterium]